MGLFLLSILLFTLLNIFHLLFPHFLPPCLYSHAFFFFLIPDHKGLSASNAGAAAWSCSMHKLHPVPVCHTWGHRLLYLQGCIAGLHGESDAGSAGLSWRWLHHCTSFPHQYRDVPGLESQVFKDSMNHVFCILRSACSVVLEKAVLLFRLFIYPVDMYILCTLLHFRLDT